MGQNWVRIIVSGRFLVLIKPVESFVRAGSKDQLY